MGTSKAQQLRHHRTRKIMTLGLASNYREADAIRKEWGEDFEAKLKERTRELKGLHSTDKLTSTKSKEKADLPNRSRGPFTVKLKCIDEYAFTDELHMSSVLKKLLKTHLPGYAVESVSGPIGEFHPHPFD